MLTFIAAGSINQLPDTGRPEAFCLEHCVSKIATFSDRVGNNDTWYSSRFCSSETILGILHHQRFGGRNIQCLAGGEEKVRVWFNPRHVIPVSKSIEMLADSEFFQPS